MAAIQQSREAQLREYLSRLRSAVPVPTLAAPPPGIDGPLLATDLKQLPFGGVQERYRTGELLPQVFVYWAEGATAEEFLDTLPHLDQSALPALRAAVTQGNLVLERAVALDAQYEEIKALIAAEDARIDAIRTPDDKQKGADRQPPGPLHPQQRDNIRRALSDFEQLQASAASWAQTEGAMESVVNWHCIARVAAVAVDMVRKKNAGARPQAVEVQQALDTLNAFLVELEKLAKHATPSGFLNANSVSRTARDTLDRFAPLHQRFLQLPGLEGRATIGKIVSSIGNHALLSVSALSGFVGLCGYIKACLELEQLELSALTFITTADVANFAIAMAVPFLLLVGALIGLPFFWSEALVANHRRAGGYVGRLLLPIAVIVGTYVSFCTWAQLSLWPSLDAKTLAWTALLLAGLWPAMRLFVAGKRLGVDDDDDVQGSILSRLRFASSTPGLLLGLAIGGCILILAHDVRVVVPNRLPVEDPARGLRVLETSYPEPILAASPPARVGEHWVLRRAPGSAAKVLRSVRTRPGETSIEQWPLMLVNRAEVVCLRPVDNDDGPSLHNRCVSAKPSAEYPHNSIARFAVERLECGRAGFDSPMAVAVMRFPFGLPANDAQAGRWTDRPDLQQWWASSSQLQKPALRGIAREVARSADELPALRDLLERDLSASLWILGFASTPGRPAPNLDLAERRARALQAHLLRNELDALPNLSGRVRILAVGEGDLSGVVPNENAQIALAFICANTP